MSNRTDPLNIWLVDPVNYSGMAYYDAGLAGGLADAGANVTLVGSDRPLVSPTPRERLVFKSGFSGTAPNRAKWRRALSYGISVTRLARALQQVRPDWLLWNYVEQPTLDGFAIRRARARGAKIGFIAHETEPWEGDASRRRIYQWLVEEAADAVIVHGETNAEIVRRTWDVEDGRIIVSEHGDYREWVRPATNRATSRSRLALPKDAPIALLFGTLRMSKGLKTLLAAWPIVRRALPSAELLIAGRPYRGTDLASLGELGPGVTLHAHEIPAGIANDYYAACDVVAIPYEKVSTSGVLRYAYSACRPVVATRTGELRTHVLQGETGWLVPSGDRQATADALIAALIDRTHSHQLGVAARGYAQATFDWTAITERLLADLRKWYPQ